MLMFSALANNAVAPDRSQIYRQNTSQRRIAASDLSSDISSRGTVVFCSRCLYSVYWNSIYYTPP